MTRSYHHHREMTVLASYYHKGSQKCKGCKISCFFDLGLCSLTTLLRGSHNIPQIVQYFPTKDNKKLPPPSSDDSCCFPLPQEQSKIWRRQNFMFVWSGVVLFDNLAKRFSQTPQMAQCFQPMIIGCYKHNHQMTILASHYSKGGKKCKEDKILFLWSEVVLFDNLA